MLLSRIWYFAIAAVAATTLVAVLLLQMAFNRQHENVALDELRRDRFEFELMLNLDARSRLSNIAVMSADGEVRSLLRGASGRRGGADAESQERLRNKLDQLNRRLEKTRSLDRRGGTRGDLVFAVSKDGTIVAQLGAGTPPDGASLGAFPLVERALAGFVRDDVWVYNEQVYRMAARPVIDGGQYVGAIVHGKRIDDRLATELSERLNGAGVVFFLRDRVIASHVPAESAITAQNVEGRLREALADQELQGGGRTPTLEVGETGRAVYSLLAGSAAYSDAGYSITRPVARFASPFDAFDEVADEDVAESSGAMTLVGVGALLVFALAMVFVWLERDRPLGRLRRESNDVSARKVERLNVSLFGGGYRRLAIAFNEALDKVTEVAAGAGPARSAANLDEILGPTPSEQPPSFFGFASEAPEGTLGDIPEIPAAPSLPHDTQTVPTGGDPVRARAPAPAAGGPPRIGAPPPPPPQPPPVAKPSPSPAIAPPNAAGPAASPPAGPPPATRSASFGGAAAPEAVSRTEAVRRAPAAPAGMPGFDDEGATMVAQVPSDLLAAAAELGTKPGGTGEDAFRQVFEEYLATKRQCGESTAGLTFERFAQTLRKNREDIMSKHGAEEVRFAVYVKDGRAALKATPVK